MGSAAVPSSAVIVCPYAGHCGKCFYETCHILEVYSLCFHKLKWSLSKNIYKGQSSSWNSILSLIALRPTDTLSSCPLPDWHLCLLIPLTTPGWTGRDSQMQHLFVLPSAPHKFKEVIICTHSINTKQRHKSPMTLDAD